MKNIISFLVAIIGVVVIVFGVLFIVQASKSKSAVLEELQVSGITASTLDDAYEGAKATLGKAIVSQSEEAAQSAGWQKVSLGLAKSSLDTARFVQMCGFMAIIIGVGFVLTAGGLVMTKKN